MPWWFLCPSEYGMSKPKPGLSSLVLDPVQRGPRQKHTCLLAYDSMSSGLSSAPSAFGFVFCLFGLPVAQNRHMRRFIIILMTGQPRHHTNNESNHQHCRLGLSHDLRQSLSSGTPWRQQSDCKSMSGLLLSDFLFFHTKQTLTSFPSLTYFTG